MINELGGLVLICDYFA